MKFSKYDIKIARQILEASLEEGKIDETRLFSIISTVKKMGPNKALGILKPLLKEVSDFYQRQTLKVEGAQHFNLSYLNELKEIFESKTGKSLKTIFVENKSLIGGIKITLADNVWDYSVNQSLENFKERLHG